MAFDACDAEPGTKLQVGQLLETAIVNADNAAMLHVTAKQAPVATALLTEHAGLDMGEDCARQLLLHIGQWSLQLVLMRSSSQILPVKAMFCFRILSADGYFKSKATC